MTGEQPQLVRVTRTWYVWAYDAEDALASARPGEHTDVEVDKLCRHPYHRKMDHRVQAEQDQQSG